MANLDDIEHAIDDAVVQANADIAKMSGLVNEAIAEIKTLMLGADPVYADAIVAKVKALSDTLTTTANAPLDALDAVLHPPAPVPTPAPGA